MDDGALQTLGFPSRCNLSFGVGLPKQRLMFSTLLPRADGAAHVWQLGGDDNEQGHVGCGDAHGACQAGAPACRLSSCEHGALWGQGNRFRQHVAWPNDADPAQGCHPRLALADTVEKLAYQLHLLRAHENHPANVVKEVNRIANWDFSCLCVAYVYCGVSQICIVYVYCGVLQMCIALSIAKSQQSPTRIRFRGRTSAPARHLPTSQRLPHADCSRGIELPPWPGWSADELSLRRRFECDGILRRHPPHHSSRLSFLRIPVPIQAVHLFRVDGYVVDIISPQEAVQKCICFAAQQLQSSGRMNSRKF